MDSFNDVFQEVLKYCRNCKSISEPGYNKWIKILEPMKLENNVAYLLTDSDFSRDITMNAYENLLKEAFLNTLGFEVDIKILVKDKEEVNETEEKDIEVKVADFSDEENNNLTFDNFIKGKSNDLAYAFSTAVAHKYDEDQKTPSNTNTIFNPLIIYGDSGLGKTHLMKAIESKETNKFHDKYRNADYLMVDDIQTIAGKERMQEEFFHTFNDLYNAGKQIVLTSDIAPSKISKLQNRILTRFSLGVQVDVTPPDFETRMAIVKKKADMLDLQLSDNVVRIIAEKIKTNIRQLEGTVNKIKALTIYTNESPSISMAQRIIKEIIIENHPAEITVDRILQEVAAAFDVTADDIKSTNRRANVSLARKIAIYLFKDVKGMTFIQIGNELNKNHSTMTIHYQDVVKNLKENKQLKDTVDDIIKNLKDN